jgi:hypothetical protein
MFFRHLLLLILLMIFEILFDVLLFLFFFSELLVWIHALVLLLRLVNFSLLINLSIFVLNKLLNISRNIFVIAVILKDEIAFELILHLFRRSSRSSFLREHTQLLGLED